MVDPGFFLGGEGRQPEGGTPNILFSQNLSKLHENEENGAEKSKILLCRSATDWCVTWGLVFILDWLVAAKNYTEEPKYLIILLRNGKGRPSLHVAY